ncbi:hypothetical protein K438DRAFT_1767997 [Mycena galopus ATCC 62051]|nr:hypothetical protein K438DRAFT_1767997 [Mycena galopus ATCC 62051]
MTPAVVTLLKQDWLSPVEKSLCRATGSHPVAHQGCAGWWLHTHFCMWFSYDIKYTRHFAATGSACLPSHWVAPVGSAQALYFHRLSAEIITEILVLVCGGHQAHNQHYRKTAGGYGPQSCLAAVPSGVLTLEDEVWALLPTCGAVKAATAQWGEGRPCVHGGHHRLACHKVCFVPRTVSDTTRLYMPSLTELQLDLTLNADMACRVSTIVAPRLSHLSGHIQHDKELEMLWGSARSWSV